MSSQEGAQQGGQYEVERPKPQQGGCRARPRTDAAPVTTGGEAGRGSARLRAPPKAPSLREPGRAPPSAREMPARAGGSEGPRGGQGDGEAPWDVGRGAGGGVPCPPPRAPCPGSQGQQKPLAGSASGPTPPCWGAGGAWRPSAPSFSAVLARGEPFGPAQAERSLWSRGADG